MGQATAATAAAAANEQRRTQLSIAIATRRLAREETFNQ